MRAASPGQVLAIVCVAMTLASLDLFIVNVALPDIARDFGDSNLGDLSWILNGYAIVYAALLVFFGRTAERYSRNDSFLLGVAIFTAASAACSMASGVEMLVAFRLAQAAGAALLTPTSLGLLLASFPPEKRGGAVRVWSAVGGFAAALGPPVGGLLVMASWRWIFLVNVPIGLLALAVGWRMLPSIPGHDAPGPYTWAAALVTAGIGALTFGIIKIGAWGWGSPAVGLSFGIALVCLGLFAAHCLRSRNPFVDPGLFRIRPFTGASLAMLPFSMTFGGFLLSVVLWEQGVWGWPALETGFALAFGPFLVPVTSLLVAGRLIARFGPAPVVAAGLAFFCLGVAWWAVVPGPAPNLPLAIVGMIPSGIGVGLTLPTLMGVGTSSLPPSSFATGSGVINMIRQTGMAIGVAVFVVIAGAPGLAAERIEAFHRAWWVLTAIAAFGFIPLLLLKRPAAVLVERKV